MEIEGDFRRRLGTACQSCKKRKVRCDVSNNGPCTPCTRIGAECLIGYRDPTPSASSSASSSSSRRKQARAYRATGASPLRPTTAVTNEPALPSSPTPARDESLTKFYERGIGTRNWEVFCDSLPIRIVYIGNSTANLQQLVQTEDPGNPLHYPFPPIKPLLPWRPQSEQLTGTYLTTQAAQDLASLPTQIVRDSLVQTYFDDIHPGFPIIDEGEFRRQYRDETNPPALLLFHAVLLAAARISDHPMVATARSTVTATLYRRAKALFDMRYENDRVHLVQTALLLAWHVENSDTISCNAYQWIGQAARIAMGLGMHRDLLNCPASIMPVADRRVYRKCWWAILQAEALTALKYGRPPMIREDDYDQPPMGEADFLNFDNSTDTLVQSNFFMLNSRLGEIALQVASLSAPRSRMIDVATIDNALSSWVAGVPITHDLWSCLLRVNFSMIKLVLHRPGRSEASPAICAEAASTILTTYETMAANGTLRMSIFYASTAFLAAAIQFSREVKEAVERGASMAALSAQAQLERLLRPIATLAVYWPNLEALHKLCVILNNRSTGYITKMHQQPPAPAEDYDTQAHINWAEIMAGYQLPQMSQDFNMTEWMNQP